MRPEGSNLKLLYLVEIMIGLFACIGSWFAIPFVNDYIRNNNIEKMQASGVTPTSIDKTIPEEKPTPTSKSNFSPLPATTVTPTVDPECDFRMIEVRESMPLNSVKTYTRCPIGKVEYSIQVDDQIQAFTLECPGEETRDIKYWVDKERSQGQQLNTFASETFSSFSSCKVRITIVSNNGDKIGYTVWQEVIGP